MKRLTQRELVALYIASKEGEFVYSYQLKSAPFITVGKENLHIGSEGDRRALELFEPDQTTAEITVRGVQMTLERDLEGKYRKYRLVTKKEPPRYEIKIIDLPNGERVARQVLVN